MPDQHADKATRARSFGAAADAYERARPEYPDAAVEWLVPEGARTVLDLGAGTGKLTRALVAKGFDVIAIEPLTEMRETLTAASPEVRALAGTAEEIPLPDESVDAITVAQAWHWVDPVRATAEVELMDMDAVEIGAPFGPTETFVTDWARPMDVDLLVEMAASRSYVITATPRRRREILDGVRRLVEDDPDLGAQFDLPYRTFCYRAVTPA